MAVTQRACWLDHQGLIEIRVWKQGWTVWCARHYPSLIPEIFVVTRFRYLCEEPVSLVSFWIIWSQAASPAPHAHAQQLPEPLSSRLGEVWQERRWCHHHLQLRRRLTCLPSSTRSGSALPHVRTHSIFSVPQEMNKCVVKYQFFRLET